MTDNSSRKPSESSARSGARSSSDSSGNRNLGHSAAASMYGLGYGSANNMKGLNSGWQVWGGNESSRRNPSVSSAASGNELSPPPSESWTASRPSSATWDDVNDSSSKKDFPQLDSPSQLSYAMSRQVNIAQAGAYTGSRIDDRSKNGFSPQRYGKDGSSAPFNSESPTGSYGHSAVSDDLSLTMRGMAVEEELSVQSRQHASHTLSASYARAPLQQPRGPYTGYTQSDYSPYYSVPPTREYTEYSYGYEQYHATPDASLYALPVVNNAPNANMYTGISPPTLHPNSAADVHHQQAGVFYDYIPGTGPHGSPFFYSHHQPVMYTPTHSPIISQMSSPNQPNQRGIVDKKRDLQFSIQQQQINASNLLYNPARSLPSPHQTFTRLEYGTRLPLAVPYGHGPLHVYQQGMRGRRRDVDPSAALRSPLLDDFRSNKSRKWELRDIYGYIVEFSGDQHGSRFIQQKLETATSEEKKMVFDEIVPDYTLQLIQDVFGNYVVQKLFEHGTQVHKTLLANTMEGHILALSLQMYGCRVVQKAIEFVLPEQQATIVKELEPHVLRCVKDANGNHVIQKLLERVSPERLAFVNMFRGNVYELATHPYGCRVLQRCLEHLPEEHTRSLLDEMHNYTNNLMLDQFGNYVVQFVIEYGKPRDKNLAFDRLKGNMLKMAQHKFASNVCEKALVCADYEHRRALLREIMKPNPDGIAPIVDMMKDQFANYVLQRALIVAEGEEKETLYGLVRPQLIAMKKFSNAFNKHLGSIERLIEKHPIPQSDHSQNEIISPEISR